jgi:hypothetical protein
MYYKDTQNKLHEIDSNDYAYLLPAGSEQITEAEALAILAANTPTPTKSEMWGRIKTERDRRTLDGGCKVAANWFLSTERARGEYTSMAIVSAGAPATYVIVPNWRTMQDGITVDMTVGLLKQIMTAGLTQANAIDTVAQAHKLAVNASATPETYNYLTGWPAMFGL